MRINVLSVKPNEETDVIWVEETQLESLLCSMIGEDYKCKNLRNEYRIVYKTERGKPVNAPVSFFLNIKDKQSYVCGDACIVKLDEKQKPGLFESQKMNKVLAQMGVPHSYE